MWPLASDPEPEPTCLNGTPFSEHFMGPLFRCEGCGQAVADKVAAFAAAVKAGQYDAQGYTVHERRLVVRGRGMGQPGAVPICPTCRGARPCGCDGGGR